MGGRRFQPGRRPAKRNDRNGGAGGSQGQQGFEPHHPVASGSGARLGAEVGRGLFGIRATGDSAQILNPPDFTLRYW
ncbi:MAG: hypothetical protein RKR03_20380 [Candidatus Competibacter sp.]|nr:hypothetical protein [Candidatus Competibacter sp.]